MPRHYTVHIIVPWHVVVPDVVVPDDEPDPQATAVEWAIEEWARTMQEAPTAEALEAMVDSISSDRDDAYLEPGCDCEEEI